MSNVTLYVNSTFTSPYALSVFVTLLEKQVPFELKTVNLEAGENDTPAYRALSRTSRVPMLTHGDFQLSESSAISEYLETIFRPPQHELVYPLDVELLARARQIQAWLRSDLLAIREERPTVVIFDRPTTKPLTASGKIAVTKLLAAADAFIPADRDHLFDEWCIADTDLALMLKRLVANGDAVPARLERYVEVQWNRPSVQRWVYLQRHHAS